MALTKAKTSNLEDNSITIAKLAVQDGQAGYALVTDGNGNLSFSAAAGGAADFVTLSDTPSTFVGSAGLFLKVNTGETALEFGAGAADFADLTGTIAMTQIVDGSIPAGKLQDTYLTAITGLNVSELVNDAGYITSETDSQTLSLVGADLSISGGNTLDLTGAITTAMLAPSNVFTDQFTANGADADFTLSQDPGTKDAIQVFVDGVPQTSSNITLVGTTLTLGGTPTIGQIVEVRGYGLGINIATVADNSITGAKIQDNTITIDKIKSSEYIFDTFTGNGILTDFTLSADPGTANALLVTVDNIVQNPTTNFTVSGTTLTFTGPPVNSSDIVVRYLGLPAPTIVPSNGSVTSSKLSTLNSGTASQYLQIDGSGNMQWATVTIPPSDLVNDTTPQLGGDLDAQLNNITNLGTLNSHTIPGGTGTLALTSDITFTELSQDTTPQLGGDLASNGNNINMADNNVIYLGSSNDAYISYNGTNTSFTTTRDAGELFIGHPRQSRYYVNSNSTSMHMLDVGTPHIKFYAGDAGTPKLSITSNGLEVTTGFEVNVGTDQNLKIVSDNSEVTIKSADDADIANPDIGYHATQHKFYGSAGTGPHFVVSDDGQVLMPSGTADPTTNLQGGGMYFNSTSKNIRYYNGTSWQDVSVDLTPFTDLLTSSMPHSGINVTEAGIRTETASFTGATDNNITNTSVGFGWHDGHEGSPNDWPAYIAVYIGGQYPGGKPVNQLQISVHSNSFGNFELQGSNDANTSGTFYNTGTWTSLTYNATGSSYSNQNAGGSGSGNPDGTVLTFNYTNTTPYTHYRIWFKDNSQNGSSGSLTGWASYGWRMNRV